MQIPVSLDDWTLDLVHRLVESPDGEPAWFDLKEALNARDPKWNEKLSKAACAMANTGGGFLVFGVRDKVPLGGASADRIVGIPITGEERHDFGQKVAKVQVNVAFDVLVLPLTSGNGVAVVHVPESQVRPHVYQGTFYRRGDGGEAVPMDFYGVRDQMLLTQDRRARVMLFRIRLARFHRLASDMLRYDPNFHAVLERFDVAAYDVLLPDVVSVLPTDYLLDRVVTASEKANLVNATIHRVKHPSIGPADGPFYLMQGDIEPHVVRSALWGIQQNCREAEERLKQEFGPLPAGYELRYDSSA